VKLFMAKELKLRFRVDFTPSCSIGIGKIELLESIARTGSLSEAARQMRMSYRRAWLLLADLNQSFERPVARTSTGGRGGGGVVLTAFGSGLIEGYRKLEAALQPLAQLHLQGVGKQATASRPKKLVPAASIRRKTRRVQGV
jgi:molybdate transport system regulatory protein